MLPAADVLETLATRLERLDEAVRRRARQLIEEFAEVLLDYNRAQLEAGNGADGRQLNPSTYSPAYAAYKAKYGKFKQVGHVDLKLTGDFLDSFTLLPLGDLRFQVVATDAKYPLLERYGELLGIQESDLDDFFQTVIRPELESFIRQYVRA